MKSPLIDQLVYDQMFPKPRSTDPPNFQGFLQRQLIPEVRLETQAFYGHLTSQEAKYPGLDYSYQPHRARLSRYPWHRRLFRAFDTLGLTNSEIAGLTRWEGTRWAKERYERENGITIRDTTADGISNWVEPELRNSAKVTSICYEKKDSDKLEEVQSDSQIQDQVPGRVEDHDEDQEDEREIDAQIREDVDEESDAEIQSVGLALNERLRAAVAQREAGNSSIVMDEEWEQWFKEAVEAGGLPFLSTEFLPPASSPSNRQPSDSQLSTISPRLLSTTRLDNWHRIPDVMHSIARQNSDNSNSTTNNNDMYNRRISDSFSSQRQFSSSSLSRRALNFRIRQWDAQRTSMRPSASLRPNYISAIRSTQNRPGSSNLSYSA